MSDELYRIDLSYFSNNQLVVQRAPPIVIDMGGGNVAMSAGSNFISAAAIGSAFAGRRAVSRPPGTITRPNPKDFAPDDSVTFGGTGGGTGGGIMVRTPNVEVIGREFQLSATAALTRQARVINLKDYTAVIRPNSVTTVRISTTPKPVTRPVSNDEDSGAWAAQGQRLTRKERRRLEGLFQQSQLERKRVVDNNNFQDEFFNRATRGARRDVENMRKQELDAEVRDYNYQGVE
jgi:hypothetical protein